MNIIKNDQSLLTTKDSTNSSNFEELMTKAKVNEILDYNGEKNNNTLLGQIEKEFFILRLKKIFYDKSDTEIWTKHIKLINSPKSIHNNDIYKKYTSVDNISNQNLLEFIYPATEKIIEKNRIKKNTLFQETYEIYLNKHLEFINSIPEKDTAWIKNVLHDEKNTQEKLIHLEENHFKILQDLKFAGTDKAYCLGLVFNDKIKSLRDLNERHIPLLENLLNIGRKAVGKYFNVNNKNIRMYVHYPPQFYHFHVHMVDVDIDVESSAIINRAIDLHTILQNIKLKGDYYQKIDIEFSLQVGSVLYKTLNN